MVVLHIINSFMSSPSTVKWYTLVPQGTVDKVTVMVWDIICIYQWQMGATSVTDTMLNLF